MLGGGLKNGKVTPLLAARVDAALKFAWKQSKTGRKPPLLIMSGGQGEDEPLSEAEAMKEYAMEQGYDESRILLEDQSGNTAENMKFSREIMEEHSEGKPYRCALCDQQLSSAAGRDLRQEGRDAHGRNRRENRILLFAQCCPAGVYRIFGHA